MPLFDHTTLRRSSALTVALVSAIALADFAPSAQAQIEQPAQPAASEPQPARPLLPYLNALRYDTTQSVPLIVVDPGQMFTPNSPLPDSIGLPTLAEAAHLRVVSLGRLDALVPPTMWQITAKPAKADPFADLDRSQLAKLLFGTLTAAQWQSLCSDNGLGVGDLDRDQRTIWADMIPPTMKVERRVGSSTPGAPSQPDVTEIPDTSDVRLRLNKTVQLTFVHTAKDYKRPDFVYSDIDQDDGKTKRFDLMVNLSRQQHSSDRHTAFGVPISTEVPNREKPGDIGYDASALDPRIYLTFAPKAVANAQSGSATVSNDADLSRLPTVADLLDRIGEATQLHFVADSRVRDLPVYLRGDAARSGDLLRALARSVCGTFRKLPPSAPGEPTLYLLTYDREGLGTQAMRLSNWSEAARSTYDGMLAAAREKTARQNPLASLHFAPGDHLAQTLPQTQIAATEDAMRQDDSPGDPQISLTDIPPALRRDLTKAPGTMASGYKDSPQLGEGLNVYLIVPGFGAIDAMGAGFYSVESHYLKEIAHSPSLAPSPRKTLPDNTPFAWPSNVARRVLVASPATVDEAVQLATAASQRGFTELWLQIGASDSAASSHMLAAAVQAGASRHLAVGVVVSLLRGSDSHDTSDELDQNILGQTGAEFAAQQAAFSHKELKPNGGDIYSGAPRRYADWHVPPDAMALAARLAPLETVPGLAALTLRDTVAPGWTGYDYNSDGIWINGHLGYTLKTRRAFLASFGIDPIDIVEERWWLVGKDWDFGYFAQSQFPRNESLVIPGDDGPHVEFHVSPKFPLYAWKAFRAQTNVSLLADLYGYIRKANPTLPLYLDDRTSPFANPPARWFGSWDAASQLSHNPPAPEPDYFMGVRDKMRRSHVNLATWDRSALPPQGTPDDTPVHFAGDLSDFVARHTAPEWDGVAIDLSSRSTSDVLRLLTGMPPLDSPQSSFCTPVTFAPTVTSGDL